MTVGTGYADITVPMSALGTDAGVGLNVKSLTRTTVRNEGTAALEQEVARVATTPVDMNIPHQPIVTSHTRITIPV